MVTARKIRFSTALFAAYLVLVASATMSSVAAASEKIKLALNWKPEPQFGGFYAARMFDLDKKNGFEFDVIAGGAGTPVIQMIGAGKIDFGIASADEVVMSQSRGSDLVAIFAVYQTNPQGIMTRDERGFESLADVFRGNGTIAMQKGLPYAVFLQRKYAAGKRATIVPYVGGISNFMADHQHSQQCFVTSEPLLARKQGAKVKTFLVAESGFNPYTTVLVAKRSFVEKNGEKVKKVVEAVRAGWRKYLDDPTAVDKKMNELNPSMDLETFKASGTAQRSLIETEDTKKTKLGKMSEERWADLVEQLLSMKVIEKSVNAKSLFIEL